PTAVRLLRRFTPYQGDLLDRIRHGSAMALAVAGAITTMPRWRKASWGTSAAVMALYPAAHLAYLILPKTWVFPWYLPPAYLGYYFTAGLGFGTLVNAWGPRPGSRLAGAAVVAVLAAVSAQMLLPAAERARESDQFHSDLPKRVGLW